MFGAALRCRVLSLEHQPWKKLGLLSGLVRPISSSSSSLLSNENVGLLNLQEVEKVLSDVKADDVRVIPVRSQCAWTDFMVVATGRSAWHVRNIAQALIHKAGPLFLLPLYSFIDL